MEWFSYAVAVILFISSVVSPIITTHMNNKHQKELKKIDIYENSKKEALSNFIESAQLLNYDFTNPENLHEYCISFDKLFIYFSDISLDTIKDLEKARVELSKNENQENFIKANREITKIVQVLSKQIAKE